MIINEPISYAISPDKNSLLERIERGCRTLETLFPSNLLLTAQGDYSRITGGYGDDKLIKDRQKYLYNRLKRSGIDFALNNGKPNYGYYDQNGICTKKNNSVGISGQFYEWGEVVYKLSINFEAESWEAFEKVFVTVGDAIDACNASIISRQVRNRLGSYESLIDGSSVKMAEQDSMREQAERSLREGEKLRAVLSSLGKTLPLFSKDPFTQRESSAQPKELGWLNYWSAETCAYLGFPDPDRDQDLLAHSYRTPAGAWLVKLCPEPLDFDRPDHLMIFADMYERFPKLGLRAQKEEPPPPMRYPEHTIYINEGKPWHIIDRLIPFLQARGYKIVERISKKAEAESVTVGLIRGAPGWTIIKTLPEEFLTEALPGKKEPLLVELCHEIQCKGFTLNVYSEFEAALLETDGTGRMNRSGLQSFEELPEDVDFEAMEEGGQPPLVEFRLLSIEVETDFVNLNDYGQIAEQLHGLLAGQSADLCDDQYFATSIGGKQFQERQGVKLYFVPEQRR